MAKKASSIDSTTLSCGIFNAVTRLLIWCDLMWLTDISFSSMQENGIAFFHRLFGYFSQILEKQMSISEFIFSSCFASRSKHVSSHEFKTLKHLDGCPFEIFFGVIDFVSIYFYGSKENEDGLLCKYLLIDWLVVAARLSTSSKGITSMILLVST